MIFKLTKCCQLFILTIVPKFNRLGTRLPKKRLANNKLTLLRRQENKIQMKKTLALSAVLALGALGMACETANTNTNANKMNSNMNSNMMMNSNGSMSNGSMSNGSMSNGSMSNGSMSNGMRNGSMSNGSMSNGSMSNGMRNGSMSNGSPSNRP